MKRLLITMVASLTIVGTLANADLPPTYCVSGEDHDEDGNFHFINLYSPQYAIYKKPTRFTGKSIEGLPSGNDHIPFYTQYQGKIGEFQVDFWTGEQEKKFTLRHLGPVWVWVARSNVCSKDEVFVHLQPTIEVTSLVDSTEETSHIEFFLDGNFYPWSRADVEGLDIQFQVQRKIISEWRGNFCDVTEEFNEWETVKYLSSSSYYGASHDACEIHYRIRSYDGEYYSDWNFQTVRNMRNEGSGVGGGSGGGTGSSSSGGSCTGRICDIEP